jgi:hypothetical protein
MPRVQVPRHVARLVALFVVNFGYAARLGASDVAWLVAPLVVDYAYAARPGALARRAARHVARLVTPLVAPLVAPLVVDYFAYAVRPGASARRAARCRLLRLRRASGCLSMSRGSSSTTSPIPRVRVPRHVVRLITRFVVDHSVRRDFVLRPHWLYFSHAVRCDYLSRGNTGSTSSTPHAAATSSSDRIASSIQTSRER